MLGNKARKKARPAPAQRVAAGADYIAAATEAKAKRLWEAIQAAAKSAPATVGTVLLDSSSASTAKYKTATPPPFYPPSSAAAQLMSAANPAPSPSAAKPSAAADAGVAQAVTSKVDEQHSGVHAGLGALLGYEEEEDDSSSHGAATSHHVASPHNSQDSHMGVAGVADDTNSLDKELALFMQQLESDGLLNNTAAATPSTSAPTTPADSSDHIVVADHASRPAQHDSSLLQTDAALPGSSTTSQQQQQQQQAVVEQENAAAWQHVGADAAAAEVEQQVLGYLRTAPAWCKCLDGASGQAYFWNIETNEVVWEVPEELDADDLIPAESQEAMAEEAEAGDQLGEEPSSTSQVSVQPDKEEADGAMVVSLPTSAAATKTAAVDVAAKESRTTKAGEVGLMTTGNGSASHEVAAASTHRLVPHQERPATLHAEQSADVKSLQEQLQSLLHVARSAAQFFLASMPRIVRVAIEAEVRLSDLDALSKLLEVHDSKASTSTGTAAGTSGFPWRQYQQHLQSAVKALEVQLQSAEQEAAVVQEHARLKYQPAPNMDGAAAGRQTTPGRGDGGSSDAEDGEVPPTAAEAAPATAGAQKAGQDSAAAQPAEERRRRRPSSDVWHRDGDDRWPHDRWHDGLHRHHSPPRRHGSPPPYPFHRPYPYPVDAHAYSWEDHYAHHHAYHTYASYAGAYYDRGAHGYAAGLAGRLYPTAYDSLEAAPLPPDHPEAPSPPLPPVPDAAAAPTPPGVPSPDSPPPLPPATPHDTASAITPPPLPGFPTAAVSEPRDSLDNAGTTSDMETEDMEVEAADSAAPHAKQTDTAVTVGMPSPGASAVAAQQYDVQAATSTVAPMTARRREYVAQPALRTAADYARAEEEALRRSLSPSPLVEAPVMAPHAAATATASQDKKRKHGVIAATSSSKKSKLDGGKKAVDGGKKASEAGLRLGGSKKVGALVSQWMSVQKQLEAEQQQEEQAAEEVFDAEAQERKRLQGAEQWRQQQQASAAVDDNANFAPVQGDWRKALAKLDAKAGGMDVSLAGTNTAPAAVAAGATKASSKQKNSSKSSKTSKDKLSKSSTSKAAVASSSEDGVKYKDGWPVHSKARPDLDQLSKGLPVGWRAMWDKSTGDIYYGNPDTKEVSWSRP